MNKFLVNFSYFSNYFSRAILWTFLTKIWIKNWYVVQPFHVIYESKKLIIIIIIIMEIAYHIIIVIIILCSIDSGDVDPRLTPL